MSSLATRSRRSPPPSGPPGQVATLIVPADVSWHEGAESAAPLQPAAPPPSPAEAVEAVARALRSSRRTGILLGGRALRGDGLVAAARIAAATGAKLFAERSTPRLERGAGLPAVERLAYWPELAAKQLDGAGAPDPGGRKAPGRVVRLSRRQGSSLAPDGCEVHELSPPTSDVLGEPRGAGGGARRGGRQARAAIRVGAGPGLRARSPRRRSARRSARSCPKGRSSPTRRSRRRRPCRPIPRGPPGTTGSR